jgi:predicted unusual protein kinase regulating ubiquinone biosynthesis (AarF/ABC1/UbiB family)
MPHGSAEADQLMPLLFLFSQVLSVALCAPQANEHARAEQLRGVIERLGPAYVKVAQAMSTRVDLLSPEYYMQIQLLQDRVPPFPCEQAKEVSNFDQV